MLFLPFEDHYGLLVFLTLTLVAEIRLADIVTSKAFYLVYSFHLCFVIASRPPILSCLNKELVLLQVSLVK